MDWLKANRAYAAGILMIVGLIAASFLVPTVAGKAFAVFGAAMFATVMIYEAGAGRASARGVRGAFRIDRVTLEGRARDCVLFPYSVRFHKMMLLLGSICTALIVTLIVTHATFPLEAYVLLVFPFIMIESVRMVLSKPGLRILPEGLIVTVTLKNTNCKWDRTRRFIGWESIRSLRTEAFPVSMLTSNGHSARYKTVLGAFIAISCIESEADPAAVRGGQSGVRIFASRAGQGPSYIHIPMGAINKNATPWPYTFTAALLPLGDVLRYYLNTPAVRADIGTRGGMLSMDDMFGDALRATDSKRMEADIDAIARDRIRETPR